MNRGIHSHRIDAIFNPDVECFGCATLREAEELIEKVEAARATTRR